MDEKKLEILKDYTLKRYNSISNASDYLGYSREYITNVFNGKRDLSEKLKDKFVKIGFNRDWLEGKSEVVISENFKEIYNAGEEISTKDIYDSIFIDLYRYIEIAKPFGLDTKAVRISSSDTITNKLVSFSKDYFSQLMLLEKSSLRLQKRITTHVVGNETTALLSRLNIEVQSPHYSTIFKSLIPYLMKLHSSGIIIPDSFSLNVIFSKQLVPYELEFCYNYLLKSFHIYSVFLGIQNKFKQNESINEKILNFVGNLLIELQQLDYSNLDNLVFSDEKNSKISTSSNHIIEMSKLTYGKYIKQIFKEFSTGN